MQLFHLFFYYFTFAISLPLFGDRQLDPNRRAHRGARTRDHKVKSIIMPLNYHEIITEITTVSIEG